MHGYPSSNFMYMDSFMRWIVFGPRFDSVRSFDYDKDPEALVPFEKIRTPTAPTFLRLQGRTFFLLLTDGIRRSPWTPTGHSGPPRQGRRPRRPRRRCRAGRLVRGARSSPATRQVT